jgi:hypothetical protein
MELRVLNRFSGGLFGLFIYPSGSKASRLCRDMFVVVYNWNFYHQIYINRLKPISKRKCTYKVLLKVCSVHRTYCSCFTGRNSYDIGYLPGSATTVLHIFNPASKFAWSSCVSYLRKMITWVPSAFGLKGFNLLLKRPLTYIISTLQVIHHVLPQKGTPSCTSILMIKFERRSNAQSPHRGYVCQPQRAWTMMPELCRWK